MAAHAVLLDPIDRLLPTASRFMASAGNGRATPTAPTGDSGRRPDTAGQSSPTRPHDYRSVDRLMAPPPTVDADSGRPAAAMSMTARQAVAAAVALATKAKSRPSSAVPTATSSFASAHATRAPPAPAFLPTTQPVAEALRSTGGTQRRTGAATKPTAAHQRRPAPSATHPGGGGSRPTDRRNTAVGQTAPLVPRLVFLFEHHPIESLSVNVGLMHSHLFCLLWLCHGRRVGWRTTAGVSKAYHYGTRTASGFIRRRPRIRL